MTERPPSGPDDLAPWADDDLVRALRAPGTASELADEERYTAAFREAGRSNVRSLPRRAAGRLGAGGTAVVVTVALTSGVAAAYTGNLPDPVQRIAHSLVGAPAPGVGRPDASGTGPAHSGSAAPGSGGSTPTGPSSAPTASATSGGPTSGASPSTGSRSGAPGQSTGPSGSPSTEPTGGVTTPPTSAGATASAMSMSAASHRVGIGQTTTLSGLVTGATGSALPGHVVVLQVRGPRHWRPVEQVTTDATGLATATTPPVSSSARYRWHADPGVHSSPWLLRMVPLLTVSSDVGGSTTELVPSVQGATVGDRVRVLRHTPGHTVPVRRARLDDTGSATISVATPRRRAAYVVVLLPTKRHAGVRARLVVIPPRPAAVTIAGAAARTAPGGTVAIDGTVTSANGDVLPGHKVVLLRRGPVRWRPVGHAVSDSSGHVAILTPAIAATSRFRLRTDHRVHSATWRVVEQPSISVAGQRDGSTTEVTASASGARAGDKVVVFRRLGGRLVRMRHGALGADGSASFALKARKVRTTYVVRLVATKRHGPASGAVAVPGA